MRECVCPKCSANLTINDTNRDFAFCEFCGAKIMLDDYRMTQRIIDEAQLRRVEVERENIRFNALQSQRREILARWDSEQAKEEVELAQSKKNITTCLWLCLIGFGFYALPFVAVKHSRLKNEYEKKKKRRDYMRQLPLDNFFKELEADLKKQKADEEKPKSILYTKLW